MIPTRELIRIASARIKDAEALVRSKRYDGSVYLCGYAVELGLKARIAKTLKWNGYPNDNKEFEGLTSLRTHNVDTLLKLSGVQDKIKSQAMTEWSIVTTWDPNTRYRNIGSVTKQQAEKMISSAKRIVQLL